MVPGALVRMASLRHPGLDDGIAPQNSQGHQHKSPLTTHSLVSCLRESSVVSHDAHCSSSMDALLGVWLSHLQLAPLDGSLPNSRAASELVLELCRLLSVCSCCIRSAHPNKQHSQTIVD